MIESNYHLFVTGDLEKARQAYELWVQTYPRDIAPRTNVSVVYGSLGQYDKAVASEREALRLDPRRAYDNLMAFYIGLDQLDAARAAGDEALAKKLDGPVLHLNLYQLAFLQNDATGMAREVAWVKGKMGLEDILLAAEADTAAYSGRLAGAREFSRQAVASAEEAGEKETAAQYEAVAAVREAVFGNVGRAQERAKAALALSNGRDVVYGAALALAFAGNATQAHSLADDLGKRFPQNTLTNLNYLPTLLAQLAIDRQNSSQALQALQAATPYELGNTSAFSLYPVYVRGIAYLNAHKGNEALAEFQKIVQHRGVVYNEPIGALAQLQLARARAMVGDTSGEQLAYHDVLTLWRDADPDVPIPKQAKAEYGRLQHSDKSR